MLGFYAGLDRTWAFTPQPQVPLFPELVSPIALPCQIPEVKAKLRAESLVFFPGWQMGGETVGLLPQASEGAGDTLMCLFLGSLLQNKQILTLLWVDGLPWFCQPGRFFKAWRRRDTEK